MSTLQQQLEQKGKRVGGRVIKLEPLLDATAPIYSHVYGPSQALSIDESMVAF